jgi:hypothetical protein
MTPTIKTNCSKMIIFTRFLKDTASEQQTFCC